jgi:signal transduction histidine kinase/CheY-like chemotaxis protein
MDIRWKAITAVMTLMIVVCSVFLILLIRHGQESIERVINGEEESARILAQQILTHTKNQYKNRIQNFVKYKVNQAKKDLITAFAERSRERLLELSLPFYMIFKHENPYFSSIGWVLPNNHNFLRVHKPDRYGDDVTSLRPDIVEANRSHRPLSGFMAGPGGLEYRFVQPVFYEGDFLGVTQFGIKASLFFDTVSQKLDAVAGIAILNEEHDKIVTCQTPMQQCGNYTIRANDISLFNTLSASLDFSQNLQRTKIDERHFTFMTATNLVDFQDKHVGKLIVVLDITPEIKNFYTLITSSILLSLGLLAFSFIILYFSFGTLLNKIVTLNTSLTESNTNLTQAKDEVEKRVEQRTKELVLANKNLEQEITEREQAENEKIILENRLRQSQKMEAIGTLAGGIAHDFNNILGAILGYTELSLLGNRDASPIRENLQEIKKAGLRAKELVAQILTFSRRSEAKNLPVRITPVIKEAMKLLRATLPSTIEISTHFNADEALVHGDPSQIHQLMMNLCTNASQSMAHHQGILSISLAEKIIKGPSAKDLHSSPGNYVELVIADTGSGMDSDTKNRIFEPFFTTKDVGEGTGLGLAVVHGIVQSMNGTISVESAPGQGSTFHVLLPVVEDSTAALNNSVISAAIPSGSEKILLVDDELDLVKLGNQLLSNLGYQVTTSTDSLEALKVFTENPDFDLVITDQTMPGLTGLELAKKILALRSDIPVLLCTGYSQEVTDEKIREIGVRDVLMKPISVGDVGRIIRKVLDEKKV